jgi:LysM domain
MKSKSVRIPLAAQALALITASGSAAHAQDQGAPPPDTGGENEEMQGLPGGQGGQGGPGVTIVQTPPSAYPYGLPQAGYNPDAHLPSSSRSITDTSRSADGFDLGSSSGGGGTVRGSAGGSIVLEGQSAPDSHTVRRGDTLWDLSTRYFQNPYQWPRVWAYNPQIQNPHWIYPGDHVRLREPVAAPTLGSVGLVRSSGSRADAQTVFLRDIGWVDDRKEDTWGELVGSPEDKMLLSFGDDVYVQLEEGHDAQVGEKLTIFRPIRTIQGRDAEGNGADRGELVSIRGTARIDRYNPKTRMARARVIEAIDVIERGVKIGPVVRQLDKGVRPATSDVDVESRILASIYPYQLFGQNQVVFIDKGEKDGVKIGQRFFAVRRGDRWAQTAKSAGQTALLRPRVEDDRPAQVDKMRVGVDEDLLPDETYAELRVVRLRDHTATALVVSARYEVERTARLVSKKGY